MNTHLHKTAILAAALVSIASAAPVAFAQISVQGSVNAHTTVGNLGTGAADTSVNAGANGSTGTTSASADHRMNATVTGSINADHASATAREHASSDSAVQAAADAAMTQSLKASDSNVAAVTTDQNSVTVAYKVPGRFLGIFPVHVKALVTADASGKTVVHYPWYDFATSVQDSDSLKTQLQAGTWSVNAQNKAQIATSIQTALRAWLSGITASASASTTISANATQAR